MHVHSFPPIAAPGSRLLILGSMPGRASLRAGQYYAHPRNLFWELMARPIGVDREAAYEDRVAALRARGIALWDVLLSCTRSSSLDSDIVSSSIVVNDFEGFFAAHPSITHVCFNGAKAEALFSRRVLPDMPAAHRLALRRLPSTSPANAGIPRAVKQRAWSRALRVP